MTFPTLITLGMYLRKFIVWLILFLAGLFSYSPSEAEPPKIENAPVIAEEKKEKLVELPRIEMSANNSEDPSLISVVDSNRKDKIDKDIDKNIEKDIEKAPPIPEKSMEVVNPASEGKIVEQERVLAPTKTPKYIETKKTKEVTVEKEAETNPPVKPKTDTVPATFLAPVSNKGFVSVSMPPMKKGYTAYVVIEKGKENYSFKLEYGQNIPLPFKSGVYNIILYQGGGEDDFIEIERKTITASFTPIASALQQTILSPGLSDAHVQQIMKAQFKDWKHWSVEKRIQTVHTYITNTYQYDYELAENPEVWYLPSAKRLVSTGKGICYDLASLNASILREMGIPTRIVMGYPTDISIYHAWNEVYVNKSWKLVDTTVDLGTELESPFKDASDYNEVHYRF